MPLHFDIKVYVKDALVVMQGERITINPKFRQAHRRLGQSQQLVPFTVAAYCN
jgi:hypothetical protein